MESVEGGDQERQCWSGQLRFTSFFFSKKKGFTQDMM